MSKLDVTNYFKERNFEGAIMNLNDGSTVISAAHELGCKTNEIAKTLSFHVNDDVVVIVMSGDARIDNKKFKDYFNVKAKMLDYDEVEVLTNHPVGGVCPFGLKEGVKIYLDKSLKDFKYVYPAAGDHHSVLKIKVSDIEALTNGIWIDVCKL